MGEPIAGPRDASRTEPDLTWAAFTAARRRFLLGLQTQAALWPAERELSAPEGRGYDRPPAPHGDDAAAR